jgi:hypothetical protein
MNTLKKYTLISLGANCKIKIFTSKYIDQPTHLFDWIGTPAWGINKLINNNYNLFNKDDYIPLKIFTNKDTLMQCNKQYYFRFLHDLNPTTDINKMVIVKNKHGNIVKFNRFNNFQEKYERRIERFEKLLNSNDLIVFLRLEENTENKVIHDEYAELYAKPDIEYIKEFMNIINTKYSTLNYKLIYFTRFHNTELNNNLLIIHDNLNLHDDDINLETIINKNTELINKLINN